MISARFHRSLAAFLSTFAIALSAPPVLAETAPPAAQILDQTRLPFREKLATVDIVVQPDGRFTKTVHVEVQALNDAGARKMSELPLEYSDSMEELEIVDAFTVKADGKKIPVDTSAIFPQLPPGSPTTPLFSDSRQKVIVFPDLAGGDTESYTYKTTMKKPFVENNFSYYKEFPRTEAYSNHQISISVPTQMAVYVDTEGPAYSKEISGDRTIHHWKYSSQTVLVDDRSSAFMADRTPHVALSSFKNYDELSSAYFRIFDPHIAVTPKIQALADQITKGVTDKRQQTKLIYEWVSAHIRYVAIYFGNGGLEPHDAGSILENGYGDCKDHTVLFASLLRAKGIASQGVLINADGAYSLPDVAVTEAFNHIISWLPDFGLYADTTAGVAPFGTMPFSEYGKPVVHVGTGGDATHMIPVLAPGVMSSTVKSTMRIDADGKISGVSTVSAAGPAAWDLRGQAMDIQSVGPERAAKDFFGQDGNGTLEFASPQLPGDTYAITAHFDLKPDASLATGKAFYMPAGLRIIPGPGVTWMGSLEDTDAATLDTTACFSTHQVDDLTLAFPAGKRIERLPTDAEIKTANLIYQTHWSLGDHAISLHREFTSTIDTALCTGQVRADTAAALKKIGNDYDTTIRLEDGGNSAASPVAGADIAVPTLTGDNKGDLEKLDAAIRMRPRQASLYYARAYVYNRLRNEDKTFADINRAIDLKPDWSSIFLLRASVYQSRGHRESALVDMDHAVELAPRSPDALLGRGTLFVEDGRAADALKDLDQAIGLDPKSARGFILRCQARASIGQTDPALADCNQAIALAPGIGAYYHARATVYSQAKQYTLALTDEDRAIQLDPKNAQSLWLRSMLKKEMGDNAGWKADLAAAEQINPKLGEQ